MAANNTMDAIKKKMMAMKIEKENALDKADQLDQKLNEQKECNEKVCASRTRHNVPARITYRQSQ